VKNSFYREAQYESVMQEMESLRGQLFIYGFI